MSGLSACVLLADELKRLRERTGLSFVALGTKTLYSKSSWSRYVKGEVLPPWKAVQALCGLAGEAESRLRVMWELAEQEWSRRDVVAAAVPAASVSAVSVAVVSEPVVSEPLAPPQQGKSFPSLPGWVWLMVGVVLAGAAFGIGSRYRSGEPARSSGVSCVGTACDGLDPGPTFCGGAPTPLGTWSFGDDTELDVRYSAACRSAWGRVWHGSVGGRVSISVAGKDTRSAVVRDASESTDFVYTMMVPALTRGATLRVCWTPVRGAAVCRSVAVPK